MQSPVFYSRSPRNVVLESKFHYSKSSDMFYWITIPSQELTLKLEKLTEERGKKNKMLDNEVTNTLTTQVLFLVDLDIHMFIDSLIFW